MKQNRQHKLSKNSGNFEETKRKPAGGFNRKHASVGARPEAQNSGKNKAKIREKSFNRDRQSLPEGVFQVEGIAAIREYLKFKPSSILKIFAKERSAKSVRDELSDFHIDLVSVPESSAESSPHTPAWAHVRHELTEWTTFMNRIDKSKEKADRLVLVLDHISDPRNLGAIVRTAAFFGVKHVVVPDKRQVLLTQSSVNTAQGGFALTDLVLVVNVSRAIEELKTKDYWVLGAAMEGEAVAKIRGRYDRQVLILGAEDKGISQHVLGRCDIVVGIHGVKNSLESLNVSVAAGILIHELAVC